MRREVENEKKELCVKKRACLASLDTYEARSAVVVPAHFTAKEERDKVSLPRVQRSYSGREQRPCAIKHALLGA